MSYTIRIAYHDEYDDLEYHTVEGDGYLQYDDIMLDPVLVRRIKKDGFVIGRTNVNGLVTRIGLCIPSHQILKIWWEDDLDKELSDD